MSTAESETVFDGLLNLLAEGADHERLMAFQLPAPAQQRLNVLLEKNRDGSLQESEQAELDSFEQLEHVVRLLKAKLYSQSQS